ncbi:MAG: hypothetical protein V1816_03370 [Pseudomonadota bacterium]
MVAVAAEKKERKEAGLSLGERLALIGLIDEGMRQPTRDAPLAADLFGNLWSLVSKTASGAKIDRLKPEESRNGFQVFEIHAESGETLGRMNMIYLKKPIPCYYLVYVEVAPPFRKHGLGRRILEKFRDFLTEKSAIGILDNIIPEDDPTFTIYLKQNWAPIEDFIGPGFSKPEDGYMVFIPNELDKDSLRGAVIKLLCHIQRKRAVIDMRDNEAMVRQTINEFKELHGALLAYFQPQLQAGDYTPLLRFMFTRFVTKLVAFRRRIGELLGYTGGESMEQITLSPETAAIPITSHAPGEPAGGQVLLAWNGDVPLSREFHKNPRRAIERLPNYKRPSLAAWLREKGRENDENLTLGDLMDLGFDPTRLKEITLDGRDYIFERIQARQLPDLERTRELLNQLQGLLAGAKARGANIQVNPPLLAVVNRAAAYVLRPKVGGIHWEEAAEQVHIDPVLKVMNPTMRLDRLTTATVRTALEIAADKLQQNPRDLRELFACFVSWDITTNRPRVAADPSGAFFETVWLA